MSLVMPNNTKNALLEAAKEAGRWLISIVVSWFIIETLKQVDLVPQFIQVKLWVFTYMIPFRTPVQIGLTLLGRSIDKFTHEWNGTKLNGIIPF